MRSLIYGAALIAVSVSVAMADDTPPPAPPATTTTTTSTTTTTTTGADPMAALYGNTLVVTGGGRPESHTHYNADHTFTGVAPAFNYQYQGTWELNAEGKVCRTFNPEPPGVTNPDCDQAPLAPGFTVGSTVTTPDGSTVSVVAGIQ